MLDFFYLTDDVCITLLDGVQITVEPDSESPHSQVEYDAHRHDDGCEDVEPLAFEWAGMSLRSEDRVEVEIVKDDLVPGIGQILYHVFKLIADAFNLVVGLVFEEHIDEVWKFLQLVYLIIYLDIAVELFQSLCIFCIFRLFDDDLLAEDMAFDTETEQFHEEHLVHFHIEHR